MHTKLDTYFSGSTWMDLGYLQVSSDHTLRTTSSDNNASMPSTTVDHGDEDHQSSEWERTWWGVEGHRMDASLFKYLPPLLTPVGQEQPDPNCLPPGEKKCWDRAFLQVSPEPWLPETKCWMGTIWGRWYRVPERKDGGEQYSSQDRTHTGSPGKFKCWFHWPEPKLGQQEFGKFSRQLQCVARGKNHQMEVDSERRTSWV